MNAIELCTEITQLYICRVSIWDNTISRKDLFFTKKHWISCWINGKLYYVELIYEKIKYEKYSYFFPSLSA